MRGTGSIPIDERNVDQLRAWDGDEGAYWARHADRFDRAVGAHHRRLVEAAAIAPTDRILDIGCGTGQTTLDAARAAPTGEALGVDLSSAMLAIARDRARQQDVANATFLQADAQVHPFPPGAFDLAISRTGAMFFSDLVAAFENVARALQPEGRVALLTWRGVAENEWILEVSGALAAGRDRPSPPADASGPFALSDPARVRTVLGAAGFDTVDLAPVDAGMWFGTDADDAHAFVIGLMGWMLDGLTDGERAAALDALQALMEAHETTDGVVFGSAAWIITAHRS